MRRSIKLFFAVLVMTCSLGLSNAFAAGFGLYGSGGGGNADWSPDSGSDFRKSVEHLSYGFALDTAPAGDNLFNYNLNLGYVKSRNKNNDSNAWEDIDLEGFLMSHNFGFGGMLTKNVRLWFGPELRLAWVGGAPGNFPDYKIRAFGLGIGPVLGINFNVGERLTFVIKTGYQNMHYYGYGHGHYSHATDGASPTSNEYDYDVNEKLFYVTLEFLARTSGSR
jgi:hypothetical protein